jgi:hypothetical protein
MTDGVILVRISSRQYIHRFLCGQVYMNTVASFRTSGDPVRGDEHEGDRVWHQPEQESYSVKIGDQYVPIGGIEGPVGRHYESDLKANVFCMCGLSVAASQTSIYSGNFTFGDTFAAIRDGPEFLKRVSNAAHALGQRAVWALVKYIPETHHGEVGIFRKLQALSYQSEFRIALFPGMGQAWTLEIGDISDIAFSGPVVELATSL